MSGNNAAAGNVGDIYDEPLQDSTLMAGNSTTLPSYSLVTVKERRTTVDPSRTLPKHAEENSTSPAIYSFPNKKKTFPSCDDATIVVNNSRKSEFAEEEGNPGNGYQHSEHLPPNYYQSLQPSGSNLNDGDTFDKPPPPSVHGDDSLTALQSSNMSEDIYVSCCLLFIMSCFTLNYSHND